MINLNKNYNILFLLYGSIPYILFLILFVLVLITLYNIFKPFNFYELGDRFSKSYFNIFDHKFYTNFGFEKNDNIDFIINIRTNDTTDDCNIKGRFKDDKVEKLSIIGDGEKCSQLKNNNL